MKAILLVAGYATRMFPLTENQPKALLPLRGKAVLDYIMEQIYRLPGIDHIYAVSNNRFHPHFSEWAEGWRGGSPFSRAPGSPTGPSETCVTPGSAGFIPLTVLDDGTASNDNRRGAIGDIQFVLNKRASMMIFS